MKPKSNLSKNLLAMKFMKRSKTKRLEDEDSLEKDGLARAFLNVGESGNTRARRKNQYVNEPSYVTVMELRHGRICQGRSTEFEEPPEQSEEGPSTSEPEPKVENDFNSADRVSKHTRFD